MRILIPALLLACAPVHAGVLSSLSRGPAVEVMQPAGRPVAAVVFVSGDAGWGPSLGRKAALPMVAAGYALVGLDALKFYDQERTPEQAAAWIAAAAPAEGPVVLMGQSFGADALVGAWAHLPASLKARVTGVGLIVPSSERFDKISLGEFLGTSSGVDNRPAAQALAARAAVLCLQGADEEDSLCPVLRGQAVRRVALPGGHMLKRDADALSHALLAWLREVAPTR